jgi:hypothetical protein
LEIDMNAALEWIDAETPHAKVLRNDPVTTSIEFARVSALDFEQCPRRTASKASIDRQKPGN